MALYNFPREGRNFNVIFALSLDACDSFVHHFVFAATCLTLKRNLLVQTPLDVSKLLVLNQQEQKLTIWFI